jgi:hypothetical protein
MSNTSKSFSPKKVMTLTVSPLSDALNRHVHHGQTIPCEKELRKSKLTNENSYEDCPRRRKFTTSRPRFIQFSRMDSDISSISKDDDYIFSYDKETRNSVTKNTPALLMDKSFLFHSQHKGNHQDNGMEPHNQYKKNQKVCNYHLRERNEYRAFSPIPILDNKDSKLTKQHFSSRAKNEDINVIFAQLQIKAGKANVVYKQMQFKEQEITKTPGEKSPAHAFHLATQSNIQQRQLTAKTSTWNALTSKAA